jgi:diguanylate cyclase (GGDEF)-like protein/PAS domain S-box-containing protein
VNDFEAELWRRDGSSIHVSLNAKLLLSEHGRPYAVQGTSRDISERKRLEAERDRVFNLTVDMLSVVAAGGTLLRVNPAWEATLGYTGAEVLGTNVWDLLHPEDLKRCRNAARGVDRGEVVTDLRGRFRCKDGGWRWLGWSMTRAGEGDVIYCVARDVTELMETQDEMLRVQEELETTIEALRANQVALEEQTAEMDRLRIAAERMANHDMLTGVANRRAWFAEATRVKPTAVAIFDIDFFKSVNDSYGHPAGDEVLREVARRLQSALPGTAFLGRLGGEEFAVLFTGPFGEAREASAAAALAVGAEPITLEGSLKIHVTVSGGLAPWRVSGRIREQSLADTYEEADAALYEAKSSGRQQLVVRGGPKAA